MKKIALSLSVLALAMGFTACDNYELPNPPAQSNPQEAPVGPDDIMIAAMPVADGEDAVINLKAFNDADELVPLATVDCAGWPASFNMVPQLYLSNDKMATEAIPATVEDGVIYAAPDAIEAAILAKTKDPREIQLTGSFAIAAVAGENGTPVYIGGPEYRFGNFEYTIKPYDAAFTVEDTYYLVHGDTKTKLNHGDKSPYDDPEFSVVIEITNDEAAAGYSWTVAGASGISYGGADLEGTLVENGQGLCTLSGPVMFTFNMKDLTFKIGNAYTVIYTPGPANGWSVADSQTLFTNDYQTYTGWFAVADEFKFCAALDWSVNWGVGESENTLAPDGGNIKVSQNGAYYASVNIVALTYSLTFMESCGVIGDATANGWDGQTNLTQSADNPLVWEGKVMFNAGGEWKIRFNDNWDFNLGGDMTNLTPGGANIATPGEGEHTVRVDLSQSPYVVTVE